jgi:hypothetical protein
MRLKTIKTEIANPTSHRRNNWQPIAKHSVIPDFCLLRTSRAETLQVKKSQIQLR